MKVKTVYACQECGAQSQKWLGRCPQCPAWNSLVEEAPVPPAAGGSAGARSRRGRLGRAPGSRTSTLLPQAAGPFARTTGPVLYCSGEESEHQIKSRGERLGVERAPLYLLAETCLERILEEIARLRPALIVVDSIQTVFS